MFTQTVDVDIMHRGSRATRRFDAGLTSRMRQFATEALPVPLVFWGVFVCPNFLRLAAFFPSLRLQGNRKRNAARIEAVDRGPDEERAPGPPVGHEAVRRKITSSRAFKQMS